MAKAALLGAGVIGGFLLWGPSAQAVVLDVGQSAHLAFTATSAAGPYDFVTVQLNFATANPFGPSESLQFSTYDSNRNPLITTTIDSGNAIYTSGLFATLTTNAIVAFNPATELASNTFYATITDLGGSFDLTGAEANFEHVFYTTGTNQFGVPGAFVAAVPEPSTWAMMLLGFAGLGYVGRRQFLRTGDEPAS